MLFTTVVLKTIILLCSHMRSLRQHFICWNSEKMELQIMRKTLKEITEVPHRGEQEESQNSKLYGTLVMAYANKQ